MYLLAFIMPKEINISYGGEIPNMRMYKKIQHYLFMTKIKEKIVTKIKEITNKQSSMLFFITNSSLKKEEYCLLK